MTKKQRKNLLRILLSGVLMAVLSLLPLTGVVRFVCFLVPYLIVGYDILLKAGKGIIHLQPFDECFLMAVATVGAMVIAVTDSGDYTEAIAVMLFYQIGEWFQSYAVGKSRRNIGELLDTRPELAHVETPEGTEDVDPEDIAVGSLLLVQPGERVPIDGIVEESSSLLDTAALTGESVPRQVQAGDEVLSGCINLTRPLRLRTTKEFGDSAFSRILELVENASSRKSRSENFITRFARVYTPAVVLGAVALGLLPPLYQLAVGQAPAFGTYLYRALTFLVISCPCALVISIPLSFFAGIGGSGKQGILFKGSNYVELLARAGVVVFDKTGTLTEGTFEVTKIVPKGLSEEELLLLAASAEMYSTHPIAVSLRRASEGLESLPAGDVEEHSGRGVSALVGGKATAVGNARLMQELGISVDPVTETGCVVFVACEGEYRGYIVISDIVKKTASQAISRLKRSGVRKTVMLTGDTRPAAEAVAKELLLDEVHAQLLPQEKVACLEDLLRQKKERETVVFVGDGLNDAPVLMRADVGISMGNVGSDAAIEASDVVIMDDDPAKIAKAIRISRKCLRIVRENIVFSIGVKVLCLVLGALGMANMWMAIFADVGVMVLAVLNSVRALFLKKM